LWDGAAKTTAAQALGALPTGLFRFVFRREGNTIYAKLNSGAEVSVGSIGTIASGALTDAVKLGRRGSTSTFLNGAVVDVFVKKAPTTPQLAELAAADAERFPGIPA